MHKLITTARLRIVLAFAVISFSTVLGAVVAQDAVKVEAPMMVTSAGQSADAALVEVVLRRGGTTAVLSELAQPDELESGNFRSLLVVMGGSQKGLGAAGVNPEDELERIKALLDKADELGITLVGFHVGGEGRRGPLSQRFIVDTAPRMHLLIVTSEGNQDGYFTEIADEVGIQLILVENTFEVGSALGAFLDE